MSKETWDFVIVGPTPDEMVDDGVLVDLEEVYPDEKEKLAASRKSGKFELGRLILTRRIYMAMDDEENINANPENIVGCLSSHSMGDWGDVCEEDGQANESALRYGRRLMSVHEAGLDEQVWIITEADRSTTTVMFPSDY